ncbi:MAG: tetratricopeptide repeat protein [Treponema sp.]
MALSIIAQSRKLLAYKKYNEVIRLLEPHVLEYRDSFAFHFYIGLAYLNLGEMGNAKDYFSTARKLKPNDPDLMAATAAMYLRRSDMRNAVAYYLRILSVRPSYTLAKKGLACIKKYDTAEAMGDFIRTEKIKSLYPMPRVIEFYKKYIKIGVALVVSLVLGIGVTLFISSLFKPSEREDITALNLDSAENKKSIDMEGVYREVLTHAQVLNSFSQAQNYFQTFHDNLAQVEINRIFNSNATFSIKQKAKGLEALLKEPRIDTIKDVFSLTEVETKPYLYNKCYVLWKGMPTNVQKTENNLRFKLLVGYDTKQTLEGTIDVFCDFVSDVDVDKVISVLGQLQIMENNEMYLKGITIHQTGKPLELD